MAELDAVRDDLIQREMELDARAKALAAEERKLTREKQALEEEKQDLLKLRDEVETVRSKFLELERLRSIYAEMRAGCGSHYAGAAAGAHSLYLSRHGP